MDVLDGDGLTPLFLVCQQGYPGAERKEMKVNPKIQENRLKVVNLLVERKANVNFTYSANGMTPLHWAVYNQDRETAKFLLDHGAQLKRNKTDHTPVDVAGFCRLVPMVDLFIEDLHMKLRPRYPQYHYMHELLDKCSENPDAADQVNDLLKQVKNDQVQPVGEFNNNKPVMLKKDELTGKQVIVCSIIDHH